MTAKLSKTQRKEIEELISCFDTARANLADFLDEIANDWDDEISEKSERWQESEAGEQAKERVDTIRAWFDEVPETPDFDLDEVS